MSGDKDSPPYDTSLYDTVQVYANTLVSGGTVVSADNARAIEEEIKDFILIEEPEFDFSPTASMRELLARPNIKEYTKDIQKMYNLSYIREKGDKKGIAFLMDLTTKKQKQLSIHKLVKFGSKIRGKITRFVHQQDKIAKNKPIYSEPIELERKKDGDMGYDMSDLITEYRYWIDMMDPTADQLEDIQHAFGIHPLTTEDILTETREKIEEYSTYLYLVCNERHQLPNSNKIRSVNVHLLLFPGLLITVHMSPINSLAMVMYHVEYHLPSIVPVDWIAYKFLDMITDEFVLMVDAIYREIDFLDNLVSESETVDKEEVLRRIGIARQKLTKIRGSLHSKREILNTLTSTVRNSIFVEQTTKVYLRDVIDQVVLMIQRLDMANEMLNNLSGTYLAMLSIEMAETDQKMGQVMKCFSAVATIMLPLTVVTGIFGMNIEVPGNYGIAPDGHLWFYMIVLGFIIWTIIAGIIFRYQRWL